MERYTSRSRQSDETAGFESGQYHKTAGFESGQYHKAAGPETGQPEKLGKIRHTWAWVYGILLTAYTAFTMLNVFVIPHDTVKMDQSAMAEVYRTDTADEVTSSGGNIAETESVRGMISSETGATEAVTEPTVTATENGYIYQDSTMTITLTERYVYSTMVYVADIQLSGIATLRSGLAEDSFGRNLTEKTSDIADRVGAILAINGDFYGFRDTGYVIRNGILYRDRKKSDDAEDLVIYEDGSMQIIREGDVTAEELLDSAHATSRDHRELHARVVQGMHACQGMLGRVFASHGHEGVVDVSDHELDHGISSRSRDVRTDLRISILARIAEM